MDSLNELPTIKIKTLDKGLIIKSAYYLSQDDLKRLYDNLYKQLQKGLIILNAGLDIVETYKINYEKIN
nr:MAG TPA: hypothetical protein [Caudoviricetes sp.]